MNDQPRLQRDLAAVPWAQTALGPPETWPQSLQTAVRTMLGSRFSMWMAWGPELTFFCNDAYRRDTLGTKYPWALGRPAREVWAEIWPEIGPRIESVITTGEATWDEALLLYLERSGYPEETYHTFSYSPLADDEGTVAGMLCVVSEDTARVVATRRMATLRDLGAATAGLLDVAEIRTAVAGALDRNRFDFPFAALYTAVGDKTSEARLDALVGLTEEPAVEMPLPERDPVVVELPEKFGTLTPGGPPNPPTRMKVLPLTSAGAAPHGWLAVGLTPHRPFDDPYRGFLHVVARQISGALNVGTIYAQQRRRAEELAELDRAKTQFFTNISHELRTPLTLMLGPLGDALGDAAHPLAAVHRDRVEVALRNAERLLGLVNTLLDFSRLEAGRVTPTLEPLDLASYTADLVRMFDSVALAAGLALDTELPPAGRPVPMDRDMWAKIVLNLLSNAVKFTFAGGISVALRMPDSHAGSSLELTVRDTGIGIEPADQARLFERFTRVEGARSRSHEGSGIGLALVAELVDLLGGTVELESAPGVGSVFTVRVPIAPPAATPPEGEATDPQIRTDVRRFLDEAARWVGTTATTTMAPSGTGDESHGRILVVDDNADMRAYLASLLGGTYTVDLAVDGLDALEHVTTSLPDLVLTDVMMPGLDGFGLVARLRADPATADLPVIMISARAGEDGVADGLEAGADDYLTKPFTARELLARIRANLGLKQATRERAALEDSRALLDQAQRLARVGSWAVDLRTYQITTSTQFARMLGATAEDFADLDMEQAAETYLFPESRQEVIDALLAGRNGGRISVEATFRRADGSPVRMQIDGEVERDADGIPVRLLGSIQDIEERTLAVEQAAAEAAAREAAVREHRIAEELQASLLPGLDFDPDYLQVAAFYRAGVEGTQVGGDWYDVIELGAGRTALVIGDVMGRGVRAAAVMGQLRSAIRAYARLDLPPADILELVDGAVRELGEDQIVTCVYAVFDPVERTLSFANAGHLPPLLASPGRPVRVLADGAGPPMGSGPIAMSGESVELHAGDTLVLYTDGLVERRSRDIDIGVESLAAGLRELPEDLNEGPPALVARMLPDGPDDDIAILLARIPHTDSALRSAILPVPPDLGGIGAVRDFVTGTLTEWGISGTPIEDITLLANELTTNALTHGQGEVDLRLRLARDAVMVEVSDEATVLPRRLRSGLEHEHGRGLLLVTHLAERWGVRPTPNGKCVWCVVSLRRT
ncbi:SpoIIE family protein phosphatase [Sporichthya polymorpha]|uniref:SpoIIE family protein phosphatase n=1 Tax=Sporichthya polymorpha TaxID=35751 RepID=UPI00035C1AFD|nr:SpoIIE family protein phosphatase [Sporichthya polymorpha]